MYVRSPESHAHNNLFLFYFNSFLQMRYNGWMMDIFSTTYTYENAMIC